MKRITKITVRRSMIMLFAFLLMASAIIGELFKLQVLGYDEYYNEVFDQLTVETNVNPERGIIYDRNGEILATNKTVWSLYLCPKVIKDPQTVAKGLSEILGVDYEVLLEKAKKTGYKLQVVDADLDEAVTEKVREFIDKNDLVDQVLLNASSSRYYPFSTLASHTIGFVNADGVGTYGLEKVYNNILEGTSGKYITAQNAQGGDMPFQYEEYVGNEGAYNLVTTIDLYIQYQLEVQLKAASIESGAQNRSVGIVMNPETGEIYGMAVYPAYDLNQPYVLDSASQIKLEKYEKNSKEYKNEYLNLLFTMWNNKAVTELYEPGSTFKIVTTAVALQENAATLSSTFTCTGSLKVDGFYRAISCHKRTGHGTLTFAEALQQSCNPAMMRLALSIGKEEFYQYFQRFGYTTRTGIDLPSESTGYYHSYSDFSNVSLAVYSFGQTFKTTAIQQIRAVSAVANGGYLVTPRLLKAITDKDGNIIYEATTEKSDQIIDTDICNTISQILREGVDGDGGAKNAYVAGYSIAAKTGTSEKKDKYDENGNTSYRVSSTVAYGPAEDAEIAVIMLIDEPSIGSKYGSVVAAPYVSKLMELILPYIGVEADYSNVEAYEQYAVPNLEGMSIEEATKLLKKDGIGFEIVGNGEMVTSQMPKESAKVYKVDGKIILYTGGESNFLCCVPNVIGKTAEEANKILVNSGFNIKIEGINEFSIGQGAIVTYQSYAEGEMVSRGTIITVKILFTEHKD